MDVVDTEEDGHRHAPNSPSAIRSVATTFGQHVCLAIPGQIIEVVDQANRLAKVDVAGVRRTINVGLLDVDGQGVSAGDWVLIHVGFAISQVDEAEALATRRQLERLGEDYETELEELKASVIE